MTKRFLDWKSIEAAVESLALDIERSGFDYEAVTGLPRGGLVPAVMLSHRLGIPFFFNDKDSEHFTNFILVDDICDSGLTLQRYSKYKDNIKTATIHYKLTACYEPDFWYETVSDVEWLVYPWERDDSETIQDYKKIHDAT